MEGRKRKEGKNMLCVWETKVKKEKSSTISERRRSDPVLLINPCRKVRGVGLNTH